jgi:hypothetical protein
VGPRACEGQLPGGSGNGSFILAQLGEPGTLQLPARQPGQSKTQYPLAPPGRAGVRSACTVPHTVPVSFREAHVGRCPGVLAGLQREAVWNPKNRQSRSHCRPGSRACNVLWPHFRVNPHKP